MKIPGTDISERIKTQLSNTCSELKEKGITPTLAVILIGSDPSSHVYVTRKKKIGSDIGVDVRVHMMPAGIQRSLLLEHLNMLNTDPQIHGIIIQRPTPVDITREQLDMAVAKEKDVDGFRSDSPFYPPIATAIMEILNWVYCDVQHNDYHPMMTDLVTNTQIINWLREKSILVIGRGETGGTPIITTLQKLKLSPAIANSRTSNLQDLAQQSDIIISCVGKSNIVRHLMVNERTILLGVGMHPDDEKMRPDYDVAEIADTVMYYTPVPGGVGPVNVVCLMKNVIKAATV